MQRELVRRAIEGDHDAFSDLVDASVDCLHAVANLILRDSDRAQDAVQDALVSAWKDMRALRDPDAWDAWIHRITVLGVTGTAYPLGRSGSAGRPTKNA
jgi:RNA polymerase sigma-70 factor (ECF subfamily)